MLSDTHAHLYWESFKEDIDEIIQRSKDSGLSLIINVGVDLERSAQALKQVKEDFSKYTGIEFLSSIGLHPHEAIKYQTPEEIEKAVAPRSQVQLHHRAKEPQPDHVHAQVPQTCVEELAGDEAPDLSLQDCRGDGERTPLLQRPGLRGQGAVR